MQPPTPFAATGPADLLGPDERQLARLSFGALGVLGGFSMLGVALSPYLVTHHPLLLVAMSPLGRHLLLAAASADPLALGAVTVVRRMLFYGASFGLGRALGPAGIPWIEARAARFGRFVRLVERLFSRASHLVVLTMAGPTVSALAGISGMRVGVFVALASLGLAVRMLIVLALADWLRLYLDAALGWLSAHWVPATVVMAVAVALYAWRRRPLAAQGTRLEKTGR